VSPSLSSARVLPDNLSAELSQELFPTSATSSDICCGVISPDEEEEEHKQAHLDPLTLVREGRRAVFPMPLQQDAKVFSA
jgi:hypothetical protein